MSSGFDRETLEFIAAWSERIAVWFTFVGATGAIIFVLVSKPLKKMEAAERNAEREAAEKQLEEVKKRQEPRGVPVDKLLSILRKAPPAKAIMEYQDGSPEIFLFAGNLHTWLTMAGWEIPPPVGVPSIIKTGRGTALADIQLVGRKIDGIGDPSTSVGALWKALEQSGYKVGGSSDQTLPDDTLRILIGPKL